MNVVLECGNKNNTINNLNYRRDIQKTAHWYGET